MARDDDDDDDLDDDDLDLDDVEDDDEPGWYTVTKDNEDEEWWKVNKENVWEKLNAAAAIALGVYVIGFRFDGAYDWLTSLSVIFFIVVLGFAVAGAVTTARVAEHLWGDGASAWAILAGVFMVFVLGHAAGDAATQQHSNCWRLSGNSDKEIVACAPGSEPVQGGSYSSLSDSGFSRYCEFLRDGDGDVSIWSCSTDEF